MPALTVNHCLICEDIRLERRNLNSYMGVYGSTPDVGIRLRDFKQETGFVFVFTGPGLDGKFNLRAEMHSSSGPLDFKMTPEMFTLDIKQGGGAFVFAFRVRGVFPSPGKYHIVVFEDSHEFFRGEFALFQGQDSDFA